MNKKLIVGMLSAFMAIAPWSGHAAQTIDSPHANLGNNGTTENCIYCHNQAALQPNECSYCHFKKDGGPYGTNADGSTTAPFAKAHQALKCTACHNPHVSLQEAGTITGSFSDVTYDPVTGTSTLSGLSVVPETNWVTKSGSDPYRGMILWVADNTVTPAEKASYEVKGIDAATSKVTVLGNMPISSVGSFDLRRGQLIAKKVTKTAGESYRVATLGVQFPSQGSTSIFVDTVNATPTGVCQVCHTATLYWTSAGGGKTHNPDRVCTDCHLHSSGFKVTGCTACHPGEAPSGAPVDVADLATPATGSATAGMHNIHATTLGLTRGSTTIPGYNYACSTCHVGTGMDLTTDRADFKDGIQIGFSTTKYQLGYFTSYNGQSSVKKADGTSNYDGTNLTTVTNTGAVGANNLKCSNVYCHSNGKSVRLGCVTSLPNTSPAWDGLTDTDNVRCNNCHGYNKTAANPMASGTHITHVQGQDIACAQCHADTVDWNGNIINTAKHANGAYDLKAAGMVGGVPVTFTYNPTTRTCTNMTGCHTTGSAPYPWGKGPANTNPPDAETCPDVSQYCVGDVLVNLDPVVAYQTANIDDRTLSLTDISLDPDLNDPIKHDCQGGGHDGSPGLIQLITNDPGMGNFVGVVPLQGPANPSVPIVRSYSDAYVDKATDPNAPRLWFYYRISDNGPNSWLNSAHATNAGNEGWAESGWRAHVITPVDMTKTNALPVMNFTPSAVNNGNGTYTLSIADASYDPDYNDTAKRDYMGGGHDGSPGYAQILLNTGGGTGYVSTTFTDQPGNAVFSTTVTGHSGEQVWYLYVIYDNHYMNSAAQTKAPSHVIYSGWKYITLP